MRHIYPVFLALLLLLSLCGCTTQQPDDALDPPVSSVLNTTSPTAPVQPQVRQQPMIAASLPISEENYTAEDGTVLLRHVYQNLELIVPDQDVADAIIIDFLSRTDNTDALNAEALEAYNANNLKEAYLRQITFRPTRLDQSIFSLLGSTVTHKGYAHPEVTAESVTYDLVTGKVLTIFDVLNSNTAPDALYDKIIAALRMQEDDLSLYEGYEHTVSDLLASPTNWYFSHEGLVFYYSPYEIAPYASGVITAEIEYTQLTGLMNDAYFPAESDTADGELQISSMVSTEMDRFSQIAELICSENSQQAVLYTDGLIKDIHIEQQRGNGEYSVFASPHITPGDGIVIYLSEEDTLRIYYTVNGESESTTLRLSADGVPQLTE